MKRGMLNEFIHNSNGTTTVVLTRGIKKFYALIDTVDYRRIKNFKWYIRDIGSRNKTRYAYMLIYNRTISMHRYIMSFPNNISIDHIDNNGLNNTKENLRLATPTQQLFAREIKTNRKLPRNIRLRRFKKSKGYNVRVTKHGKIHQGGTYKTLEEAIIARDELVKRLYPDEIFYENKVVKNHSL